MALIVLAGYVVLAVFLFGATWIHPTVNAIGLGNDPPQFMWSFAWPGAALTQLHSPFTTDVVDFPVGVNLMWNASMLLVGAVTWPITALVGPIATFNVVETLALALSSWTAFLWLRRHVSNSIAAAAGAALFGFSPGMLGQSLGHPHVTAAFMVPLIFIVLENILIYARGSAVGGGALLGVLAATQLLIGEEVLVTAALIAGLGLLLLAGTHLSIARSRLRRGLTAIAVAAAIFLVLAAIPLYIQFFGPQRIHGPVHATNFYISDLLSFVTPDQQQWLAPAPFLRLFARFVGSSVAESNAYLGVPLIILLLYTAVRFWDRIEVRVATLLGAMLAILSIGPTVHVAGHSTHITSLAFGIIPLVLWRWIPTPATIVTFGLAWLALNRVPFLENLLPVRLTIYVYLFAGVLLAAFISAVLARPRPDRAIGAAALVAALIPLTPALPYASTNQDVPAYFTSSAVERIPVGSVAIVFPFADPQHGAPMLWQATAGMRFKMPGGYQFIPAEPLGTSLYPPASATYGLSLAIEHGANPSSVDTSGMVTDLQRWNAKTVIVGPMANENAMITVVTGALGREPEATGGVYVWVNLSTPG
jgi:hypothetical protein